MPDDVILLAHGSGGKLSHDLVTNLFARYFANPALTLEDATVLVVPPTTNLFGPPMLPRLAFSTDSYVVSPLFFPGGDIGKLAVCGTVNNLAMRGALPQWLSAGFILEEGLPLATLERIVASMAAAARKAGVQIVAGDTKVVGYGGVDQIFVNTAGIGLLPVGIEITPAKMRPGDQVVVSGSVGDHGMTILTQREGLQLDSPLKSDCAPLNGLVTHLLDWLQGGVVNTMRDPTRGGLATTLVELALASNLGIEIDETCVPVRDSVRAACELLGLDPLYVANEGKLVAVVDDEAGTGAVAALREHELGREAAVIGRVTREHPGQVVLRTALGARRVLDMLTDEQLPRIC